jgi:mannonate dehydratase
VSNLKIKDVNTILTCPGRNYLIVKIVTDNGIVGYGDATLNGRELAVKATIEGHIAKLLIGSNADRISDIWEFLFRGTYWRGGPVFMTALAGVDMALWDIKGKKYGAPLYEMLGGKCRDQLKAYFHVHGNTKEELLERINLRKKEGCRCVRYSFDMIDPLNEEYTFTQPHQDMNSGKRIEVKEEDIHKPKIWDSDLYKAELIDVTAYLRENLGNSIDLIHDGHERLTPIHAADVAKQLEPYNLLFFEDPIEPMHQQSLKMIRHHSTTPIAMGELYNTIKDCIMPVENQWIDYLRVDISHFGGITQTVKVSALAESYMIKMAFHGPSDISPIAHSALAHIDFSIPNFGIQEYVDDKVLLGEVFKTDIQYANGYITIGDKPGLGVTVDEDAAKRFNYQPKYLPTLRDREGAVHNW